MTGVSVHAARLRAGELLAREYPAEADVVVGVPDSGLDAALGYGRASGIPYGIGLIKNKYIGRTFIAPGQEHRLDQVRLKLSAVEETVAGKRVVLVDDSIVRGDHQWANFLPSPRGGRQGNPSARLCSAVFESLLLWNRY